MTQGRRVTISYCLVPFGFALRVPILYPGKAHTETLSWKQKEGKSHTDGKSILSLKKMAHVLSWKRATQTVKHLLLPPFFHSSIVQA